MRRVYSSDSSSSNQPTALLIRIDNAEAYNRPATHADGRSKSMSSQHPNESSITPHGETTFEHVARRLNLSPEKYASSRAYPTEMATQSSCHTTQVAISPK